MSNIPQNDFNVLFLFFYFYFILFYFFENNFSVAIFFVGELQQLVSQQSSETTLCQIIVPDN